MLAESRRLDRVRLVEQHVRCENAHDLDGVLSTFGDSGFYYDAPWDDRRDGRNGVRSYYEEVMGALPDLEIDVQRTHVTDDCVLLEVRIRGTHSSAWRGLPATGRRVDFPLCGIYDFDAHDRLAGETIYYDRATVLQQLGVFHDPQRPLGAIVTACSHPVTIARIAARALGLQRR